MKKITAMALAILFVLIAVSLSACQEWSDPKTTTVSPVTKTPGAATTNNGTGTATPSTTAPTPGKDIVFTTVDETVYISGTPTGALNLRKTPSLDDDKNIFQSFSDGTSFNRIGISDEWSKLKYNDAEYYAKSKYLSLTKPADTTAPAEVVFEAVNNKKMYVIDYENPTSKTGSVNLRDKASFNSTATVVTVGTELTVTGVSYEKDGDGKIIEDGGVKLGWSRVKYNEKEYFVRNSCISETNPLTAS